MKKFLIIFLVVITSSYIYGQIGNNQTNTTDLLSTTATISVTIGGDFPVNGSFPSFISERVDQFVTRLYLEARQRATRVSYDPKIMNQVEQKLKDYSLRGIKLIRSTGEELTVDLLRFRITGDFKFNPYLKNDDVLIFPVNDIKMNFFTVSGAVNKPGVFFYVEGDSLNDALELAMGINDSYKSTDKATISRLNYEGDYMTTDTVNINSSIEIKRGDQIKVIATENRRKNYFVFLLGEVKEPGSYPITKSNTKLYDVIKNAGGFTEKASLRRSKLYTKNSLSVLFEQMYGIKLTDQPDFEDPEVRSTIINLEAALMYRMSNVFPEDTSYFFLENELRILTEGSSVDFSKIDDPNSDISNYILHDGDIIVIPAQQNSVYVFGQVAKPGNIPLSEGKDYNYYIKEAGGLGQYAIEDEIMVIKGGSRHWISPIDEDVVVEEGDYIYVPKEELKSFRSSVAEYSIYVQILASVATVILLAITALK
jgi:protein involved in polysaccharide export with SLBB domain